MRGHERLPIVCFSPVPYEAPYRRPAHVLARLSERRRVLAVEAPVFADKATIDLSYPEPGLLRCRTFSPLAAGFDRFDPLLPLIEEVIRAEELGAHVAWIYSPEAARIARRLAPGIVVYDCVDEPRSSADGAEADLLAWADVVFTSAPSLHRAIMARHRNAHCFPNGADVVHFRRALDGRPEPADQASLPRPRLGFYGVVDDRVDAGLVDFLAAARPAWQLVMLGPVLDPSIARRRPNVHWLGERSYSDLPSYIAGWDVCIFPLARRPSRISGATTILDRMAAERPIVSSTVRDVAERYREVAAIAATPPAFVAACERVLSMAASERERLATAARRVVAATSWQRTAAAMDEIVAELERLPATRRAAARGDAADDVRLAAAVEGRSGFP